jgi:hypothetical protein
MKRTRNEMTAKQEGSSSQGSWRRQPAKRLKKTVIIDIEPVQLEPKQGSQIWKHENE